MRLYHYAPKNNTILEQGLYSYAKYPGVLKRSYALPAKSNKRKDIIAWMENIFPGRSKSISCLTEQMKWRGNDPILKKIVKNSVLFSFELDDLIKDGLVESIWCRDDMSHKGRRQHIHKGCDHYFYEVTPQEIDTTPLTWEKVNVSKELMYGAVRHYMIVMKKGFIPPQYLKLEKNNLSWFSWLLQYIKKK